MVNRQMAVFSLIALLFCTLRTAQAQQVSEASNEPRIKRQSLGAGNWHSLRDSVGKRDWQVQLKQLDDDSLTGRLTVVGSARIRQAKIIGQISGSDVYGVIVGNNDAQLGTFNGTISQGGMNGTYTTADGDTGEWSSAELHH